MPGFLGDLDEKDAYLAIKMQLIYDTRVLELRRQIKKSFSDKKEWLVR